MNSPAERTTVPENRSISMHRSVMYRTAFVRFAALAVVIVLAGSCRPNRDGMVGALSELEPGAYRNEKPTAERVKELERDVRTYEAKITQMVEDTGRLGNYYKLLARAYMEQEMYGPALEALSNAIRIYPENPVLFNLGGVLAGRYSKSLMRPEERQKLLLESERYYLRALELDPAYTEPLYGLSVLYVFELETPAAAEPLLSRLLAIEARNFDAMFLLARVYAHQGRIDDAVELYDRIISSSSSERHRTFAEENKKQLTGVPYGG